ncbi:type II toxin-antitoxin system HicB family antitoxin [Paenibacillus campi]|uniref:type II toxin-antitoxin system HicB family antitoxin n=1 Tax=Paenibacillus campi TaxID=3106031 RepID=UPI002B001FEF|nr:type II toxin-antitoxin system HicB family antitoxin [Paenibacillus sp. SGZ-1014]
MKDHYIFPAVVEIHPHHAKTPESGVGLYFPDIPGTAVLAPDMYTAIIDAKNMLIGILLDPELNLAIPEPSDIADIELNDPSDKIVFIEVFLPPYRDAAANKAVTVNCTVPQWMRDAGKEAKLNFSQLLQQSVKEALGIK